MKQPKPRHKTRDKRGRYSASLPCDACGKSVGTEYFTDDEVCDGGDDPGFTLCNRKRCVAKRDLPVAERRALYEAQVSSR